MRRFLGVLFELIVAAGFIGVPVQLTKLVLRPALDRLLALHPTISSALGRTSILLAFVLGYWAFARYFERRRATELSLRWRPLLLCGVSGSLLIAVTILALFASGYYRFVSYRGFDRSIDVAGMILMAATIEELVFRGLLFGVVERRFGTIWATIGGALLFGLMHLANSGANAVTLLSVSMLGILWTGVFVLSRNLWATALNHAAWNFTIFCSGLPLSGQEEWRTNAPIESTYQGSPLLTGAVFGPEDSVVSIALTLLACAFVFSLAARRHRLVRASAAAGTGASEPTTETRASMPH